MISKDHIGLKMETRSITTEKNQLAFFAKAIGETDPVYSDEDAAKAAGHPTLPALPTYAFCLNHMAPGKQPGMLEVLDIDIGRILHGEQHFKYFKPIYAGDTITFAGEITDIYDKKGGALEFIVVKTTATNQKNETVAELTGVTVVRN